MDYHEGRQRLWALRRSINLGGLTRQERALARLAVRALVVAQDGPGTDLCSNDPCEDEGCEEHHEIPRLIRALESVTEIVQRH